ncbi:MAG: sialidase family protein [Planctomycetota bacterium]|nr:glycoside hydrolase [Planctomycetota bacterium]MEC9348442.1 sialidase family protein [Planctomycetota bacterium]
MSRDRIERRRFLKSTAFAGTAILVSGQASWAAVKAEVSERRVISQNPGRYHGWPTLAARVSGQLLLVCSGGREGHVCPFGRVELMRSDDSGLSWSYPRVVMDGGIDDRDAGVLETSSGAMLITTFTSNAYEPMLAAAEAKPGSWDEKRLERWLATHNRLSRPARKASLGVWMIRSTNGGITWSGRYRSILNSPHGPIELSDGRIFYAGKQLWKGDKVGFAQSVDDAQTWEYLTDLPVRDGDDKANYHELNAIECESGRIVVHIRNHNKKNSGETLQSHSTDGGKTWSTPRSIGVWGLPSHLQRLGDGRLLMSYGHRRNPLGNQARVSNDEGKTWSAAMVISGDGHSGDLGYPSTVEFADGSLLSVWYERMKNSPNAVLRQADWTIKS